MTLALDHRMKVLLTVVLMLAVAAGAWFLGAQPALGSAFTALDQAAAVRTANDASRAQLAQLEKATAQLPALQDRLAEVSASVPAAPETSALIAELDGIAAKAGVTVDRVTVQDAAPYTAPDAKAADASVVPYTDSRITGKDLVALPVSVDVRGGFDDVLRFLDGVRNGSRLFLVNRIASVQSAAADEAGDLSATVAGYVYILTPAAG